jgi:hypothetical protein
VPPTPVPGAWAKFRSNWGVECVVRLWKLDDPYPVSPPGRVVGSLSQVGAGHHFHVTVCWFSLSDLLARRIVTVRRLPRSDESNFNIPALQTSERYTHTSWRIPLFCRLLLPARS